MYKLLLTLLSAEERYIKNYRTENKGKFIMRWSSLILLLMTILYFICTLRLPLGFGYIVNVILSIVTGFWIYKDLGGDYFVERADIGDREIPEKDTTGKDNIFVGVRSGESKSGATGTGDAVHDTIESEECDDDGINNAISSDWGTSVSGNILGQDVNREFDEL